MDKSLTGLKRVSGDGSHLPVLIRLVAMTNGPILELGTGQFSTSILDIMCRVKKRRIVSYENDPNYYELSACFISPYHEVHYIEDWDKADIDNTHWNIALIDHLPRSRRRFDAIRLKNNVDYVILHDSEPSHWKYYKYDRVYPHFKYRFDYTECMPNTTVVSNFKDLGELPRS